MTWYPDSPIFGTQIVDADGYIETRNPIDFPNTYPSEIPQDWRDNLIFDADENRWTLQDNSRLQENVPIANTGYGRNIVVQANWLKKIEAIVYCADNTSAPQILAPYVHVIPGQHNGPQGHDNYAFFRDEQHPTFNVTTHNGKIVQTPNSGAFTFIAWCNIEPDNDILTMRDDYIDSYNTSWTTPVNMHTGVIANPDNNFHKKEWAIFLDGIIVNVIVTTNLNGVEQYDGEIHNNPKIRFGYNLENEQTINLRPYMSWNGVSTNPNNPPIAFHPNDGIGERLVITLQEEARTIENPQGSIPYVFKGWYLGFWDSAISEPSAGDTYIQSDSCEVFLAQQQIIITAVYAESNDYYTITYHSGLPNPV